MALDPEAGYPHQSRHHEVTLRGSESDDLPPDERKRVTIVRKGKRATLKFERIRDLAAEWAKQLVPAE